MDQRDIDPGLRDEKGLIAHIHLGTGVPGGIAFLDHTSLSSRPSRGPPGVEKPASGIHDKRRFVDLG